MLAARAERGNNINCLSSSSVCWQTKVSVWQSLKHA